MKAHLAKVSLALLGAAFLIAGCDNPAPLSPESVGGGPSLATAPPTGSLKLTAGDAAAGDQFGQPVSVDGRRAIVGAALDGFAGSAYVFQRTGKSWSQEAKLTASDAATFDFFGFSASISRDVAIVGAIGDDGFTGSAYAFRWDGTKWIEEQKLAASDGGFQQRFGASVYLDGKRAIVGAIFGTGAINSSGSAYVFLRTGTIWNEEAKLSASDGAGHDLFGFSASISGNLAVVGAHGDDDAGTDSGSTYVFRRNGASWSEEAKLTATDGAAGDQFGQSVSVDGQQAIVGAAFDDDAGTDSGSAYVYDLAICLARSAGGVLPIAPGLCNLPGGTS